MTLRPSSRTRGREDWQIDYKSARLLARTPPGAKDECVRTLTKLVSAFNNAAGGAALIGMETGRQQDKNYPVSLAGVDEATFDKTWLGQIINDNIDPPIRDLRINPVRLSGANAGKVAYVVHVPRGTVEVQAKDFLYYMRIEDQSVPMRGFQIRDVNNRTIGPDSNGAVPADRRCQS